MGETLEDGLNERLREGLGKRFGEMLCKKLDVRYRNASSILPVGFKRARICSSF